MNRMLLLSALVLFGCTDAPTSSNPASSDGSNLRTLPPGTPTGCPPGTTGASGALPGSGALFLICVPPGFNPATGSLVVYAHGSVPPQLPIAIPNDALGGAPVAGIVTGSLGMAYATTSYRDNGLVVVDAEKDLARVVAKFRELYGPLGSGQTYAVGASEGGLIATLATERHPQLFDGTLALCAPIGDFQRQLNYFTDFRLAFDHFFPALGLMLGDPIHIPENSILLFGSPAFLEALTEAVTADPGAANNLLAAAHIPVGVIPGIPATIGPVVAIIQRLLAYNILFTNQAQAVLGGQPYDNVAPTDYAAERPIYGLGVPSVQADQAALSHLRAKYQTTGRLSSPLVALFNIGDPIVPSWHEPIYRAKVAAAGATPFLVSQTGVDRFGHCEFTPGEVLTAFQTLRVAVTSGVLAGR